MIAYFRMKRNAWKVKASLYASIAALLNNQAGISGLLQRLYTALKDVPAEDLRMEFINKLAEIIHEENRGGAK